MRCSCRGSSWSAASGSASRRPRASGTRARPAPGRGTGSPRPPELGEQRAERPGVDDGAGQRVLAEAGLPSRALRSRRRRGRRRCSLSRGRGSPVQWRRRGLQVRRPRTRHPSARPRRPAPRARRSARPAVAPGGGLGTMRLLSGIPFSCSTLCQRIQQMGESHAASSGPPSGTAPARRAGGDRADIARDDEQCVGRRDTDVRIPDPCGPVK
jgi:hypothetical protein